MASTIETALISAGDAAMAGAIGVTATVRVSRAGLRSTAAISSAGVAAALEQSL
jgi:hypothetical protein